MQAFLLPSPILQMVVGFAVVLGAIGVVGSIVEYLPEVFKPTSIHHGAVGQDERALKAYLLYHLQGGEGFAETHFGVPKHLLAALTELLLGLVDSLALLGPEDDGTSVGGDFCGCQRSLALLHGSDGALDGFEVRDKPFVGLTIDVESLPFDARTQENIVNLLVVERAEVLVANEEGEFGVEQFVADACRLCILVDSSLGSLIERLTAGSEPEDVVFVAGGFAHFETTLVRIVVDAEHVDELGF